MQRLKRLLGAFSLALLTMGVFSGIAVADQGASEANSWSFDASIYAYLPSIDGTTRFPFGGSDVGVSTSQILESLNLAAMGAFNIRKGSWGLFTDLMYVNLGASKGATREFSLGNVGLPASASANVDLGVKAWVWTIAPEYRVADDSLLKIDLFVGARYLDLAEKLNWTLTGNLGPIFAPARVGSATSGIVNWSAIGGFKGRVALGSGSNWSVPLYLDGGGGDSTHTFQAAAGISYAFQWGDVVAMWRYLGYGFSDKNVSSLTLNGPLLGVTFRW